MEKKTIITVAITSVILCTAVLLLFVVLNTKKDDGNDDGDHTYPLKCPEGTLLVDGECKDDIQTCAENVCGEFTTDAGTVYECQCTAPFVCNESLKTCEACPEGTMYVNGVCVDDTQTCAENVCGEFTTDTGTVYECQCTAPFVCNNESGQCEECSDGFVLVDGICVEKPPPPPEDCPDGFVLIDNKCVNDEQVCSGNACGEYTTDAGTVYECKCVDPFICNNDSKSCECPAGTTDDELGSCISDCKLIPQKECGPSTLASDGSACMIECVDSGKLCIDGACVTLIQACSGGKCGSGFSTDTGISYDCANNCRGLLKCVNQVCTCPDQYLQNDGSCQCPEGMIVSQEGDCEPDDYYKSSYEVRTRFDKITQSQLDTWLLIPGDNGEYMNMFAKIFITKQSGTIVNNTLYLQLAKKDGEPDPYMWIIPLSETITDQESTTQWINLTPSPFSIYASIDNDVVRILIGVMFIATISKLDLADIQQFPNNLIFSWLDYKNRDPNHQLNSTVTFQNLNSAATTFETYDVCDRNYNDIQSYLRLYVGLNIFCTGAAFEQCDNCVETPK